jgi:uncharacterized membrane protein YheB (UPF0754 family)
MKTEPTSQNRALTGAFSDIQMLIARYFKMSTRAKQSQEITGSSDSEAESSCSSDKSVKAPPNPEQSYLQAEESEIENEIGVGLYREEGICYPISTVQLSYHIKEIQTRRTRIGSITDRVDQAIHITELISHMNTYCHQAINCPQSLNKLSLQLELRENEDIDEIVSKIINL